SFDSDKNSFGEGYLSFGDEMLEFYGVLGRYFSFWWRRGPPHAEGGRGAPGRNDTAEPSTGTRGVSAVAKPFRLGLPWVSARVIAVLSWTPPFWGRGVG